MLKNEYKLRAGVYKVKTFRTTHLQILRANFLYFNSNWVAMGTSPENPTLDRLEDQIDWYNKKSASNQSWFKRIKIIELVAAALIPFLAGFSAKAPQDNTHYAIVIGCLGALIVLLESMQSLYQFQSNWISYRSTCERLKHEKYLWLAKAGHYADAIDSNRVLAERVESLISTEHAKWISTREKKRSKREYILS
jgi:hypothetical protein